jgi:hypothetical protein
MSKQPKYRRVVKTQDGQHHRITRRGKYYWVGNAGSTHMDGVHELAEQMGGEVISVPNPQYRPLSALQNFFG